MNDTRKTLRTLAEKVGARAIAGIAAIRSLGRPALRLLAAHARVRFVRNRVKLLKSLTRWAAAFSPTKLFEHLIETAYLPHGAQGTITTYVSTVSGSNTSPYDTWAKAAATVALALAAATDATFNFVYVDSAHAAGPAAAITWDAATGGSCVAIISVNRGGSTTTGDSGLLAGGSETVSANINAFSIAIAARVQTMYVYGMSIIGNNGNSGNNDIVIGGATTSNYCDLTFVSCAINCSATSATALILIGRNVGSGVGYFKAVFTNCAFTIANANVTTGAIQFAGGVVEFSGMTVAYGGATKPTTLFGFTLNQFAIVSIRDGDLSGYNTTSGNYFTVVGFSGGTVVVTNCKISATPAWTTGTWVHNAVSITRILTDSADTHTFFEYKNRLGTITSSTSIYANTGAQFDAAGVSWQIVTNSVCSEQEPFVTPWLAYWNVTAAAVTARLELTFDNATDGTDRTHWADFEFLEDASFPDGTVTSTRNARPFDGTPANLSSSAETWTGTGGFANAKNRKITVTRTAAEKAFVRARLSVGAASWTGYLDPALRVA